MYKRQFTDYDSGVAAGRIAQKLKGRNICNAKGKVSWTHASIGRILENPTTVLTFDNVLTYNKNFKKHGLEVMAGSSWTDSDYSNSWINGSHYRSAVSYTHLVQ